MEERGLTRNDVLVQRFDNFRTEGAVGIEVDFKDVRRGDGSESKEGESGFESHGSGAEVGGGRRKS